MSNPTEIPCPGYCCAAFYWPHTLAEMKKRAGQMYDGEQIANMLIPLTPKEAKERHERFSGKKTASYVWKNKGHHFTCKNWDEETRLCKAYETRPQMCRDYPYGQECQHGCGACGGVATEDRRKIREEQIGNQWKAYAAPKPAERLA